MVKLLSISLNVLLLCAAIFFLVKRRSEPALKPLGSRSSYYIRKTSMHERFSVFPNGIAFIGDSLTDEGEWSEIFSTKRRIRNYGISGDTTDGLLQRLPVILRHEPKKIFLMIGINDLILGKQQDEIVSLYRQILRQIKSRLPQSEVFIQSVLPVVANDSQGTMLNQKVLRLNDALRELASEFSMPYSDIHQALATVENALNPKFTNDGLHLNAKGYWAWSKVIARDVAEARP